jgi:hypothetical protein
MVDLSGFVSGSENFVGAGGASFALAETMTTPGTLYPGVTFNDSAFVLNLNALYNGPLIDNTGTGLLSLGTLTFKSIATTSGSIAELSNDIVDSGGNATPGPTAEKISETGPVGALGPVPAPLPPVALGGFGLFGVLALMQGFKKKHLA